MPDNRAALNALAALLNAPRPDEPVFDRLYSDYLDTADYDGWVPGGIGRVIEQMDTDTNPDRKAPTDA